MQVAPSELSGDTAKRDSANESNINSAQPVNSPEASGNEMPAVGQMLPPAIVPPAAMEKRSLLMQAAAAKKGKPEETEEQKLIREEQELLRNITKQKALKGVNELAKVIFVSAFIFCYFQFLTGFL